MKNRQINEIIVNNEEFKKIKKSRERIVLKPNDESIKQIEPKNKIIIKNNDSNKNFKRKVKKVYEFKNLEDAIQNLKKKSLGFKKKEEIKFPELEKIKGIKAIELKPKKSIFLRIILAILIIILLTIVIFKTNSFINELKTKKIQSAITEISKEKINYVFIEINPSLVLTMKDNKVEDVACLNADCMSFYNEISVKGETITNSIQKIYILAKEKGYDTSKGVKVKSTSEIKLSENMDYVNVEYISESTKKELLKDVKNNENIKNDNNNDYYANVWEKLKKDSDYDKVYNCKMENDELACYFIEEAITPMKEILDGSAPVTDILSQNLFSVLNKIKSTLTKFNIENTFLQYAAEMGDETSTIYLNGMKYQYVLDLTRNDTNVKNVFYRNDKKLIECYKEFGDYCICEETTTAFKIKDLNLLNPTDILNKLITFEPMKRDC